MFVAMKNPESTHPPAQVLSGVIKRAGIEELAATVRSFFDLEAVQLEPGESHCQLDFIAAGNVMFYSEDYPLRTHLTGELIGGRFGLALPLGGPPIKFAGEEMDMCRLASAMTGEQMDVHATGGLRQIVVLVDQNRLLELADETGISLEVRRSLAPGRPTMPLVAKPDAVDAFANTALHLLREAGEIGCGLGREAIEDIIYGGMLNLVDVKGHVRGLPSASVLVRRAVAIADSNDWPVPILRLCSLLRVSPGTLEKAFRKTTGMTPISFFLRRRLNRARAALLRADPGERLVSDIALELGFTELGRFAVRYRHFFGESPSQTLRRRKLRVAVLPVP
jgi:AraC-like DNA-binding protein